MKTYNFIAKDKEGKEVQFEINATNDVEATNMARGLCSGLGYTRLALIL